MEIFAGFVLGVGLTTCFFMFLGVGRIIWDWERELRKK